MYSYDNFEKKWPIFLGCFSKLLNFCYFILERSLKSVLLPYVLLIEPSESEFFFLLFFFYFLKLFKLFVM